MSHASPCRSVARRGRVRGTGCVALLSLALASCAVRIDDRGVLFQHDVERDRIDVLFLQEGISASDPRPLQGKDAAADLTRAVLAGRRESGFGFPLDFDLDEIDASALDEAHRELLAGITVEEVGAYVDAQGRLSWYQHFRVRRAREVVAWWNDAMNAFVRDEMQEESPDAEYAETVALWRAAARDGWTWWRLDGPRIVCRFPITEEDFASVLMKLWNDQQKGNGGPVPLAGLASVRVADEVATLVFGGDDVTLLRFPGEGEYDPTLFERLKAEGIELVEVDFEALRARVFDGD